MVKSALLKVIFCPSILLILLGNCSKEIEDPIIVRSFSGGYGQLEVGGPFVGAEFHGSRPIPSRLSFYYPVANSLDLSTDYWKRQESRPLNIILYASSSVDTLGEDAWTYDYGPTFARFTTELNAHIITITYRFGKKLPIMALTMDVNSSQSTSLIDSIEIVWDLSLRSSHSYRWMTDLIRETTSDQSFAVSYPDSGAAFSSLFVSNMTKKPSTTRFLDGDRPKVTFIFDRREAQTYAFNSTQLIGMCPLAELDSLLELLPLSWEKDVEDYTHHVTQYAMGSTVFKLGDKDLQETVYWSKALQATNRHYIDGRILPMPCPAEYNFFFTHDMLLTGQGVVNYDLHFLKEGFKFILEQTQADNILPHAYYWREGKFVTEYCNSDNWNHLWFIISAASYLKHSGDQTLVDRLYPILEKSLTLMSENLGQDGLMYAQRPDWWDIGNVYGPRAYTTVLMSKALRDFVYISACLDKQPEQLLNHLSMADRLDLSLVEKLWDDNSDYLMNILDEGELDPHYYTGSMLAVVYDVLDHERAGRLLKTVESELLDTALGVRNAMPPDFHLLGERYKFNGNEAGDQWVYFNGGVWPQGNAWYVKALHANGQSEAALTAIKKYMTIAGVHDSPNGLPSFYEYRRTDVSSPRYGEIDKPSFLWAGGFYLQSIYQLAGCREDQWNQYFDVNIPIALSEAAFDLTIQGEVCRVRNEGQGKWFESIEVDGVPVHSAIIAQKGMQIILRRGDLVTPYLAMADCKVLNVQADKQRMNFMIEGIPGQRFKLKIASPQAISSASSMPTYENEGLEIKNSSEGYYTIQGHLDGASASIEVLF